MVRAKRNPNWMQDVFNDIKAKYGDPLDDRWYVTENTPAYNTGGYYDQDVPATSVIVSPYFDTEEAAQMWMDEHEADNGKTLAIRHEQLFEYKTRVWR